MRKTLKQITKFMAVCVLFMLGSCEKDLYEDKIYQDEIIKKKITLEEFKNHRKTFYN